MKKQLIIVGMVILLLSIGLSGCFGGDEEGTKNNPIVINFGDSVTHGSIKLTFLSADWVKPYSWSDDSAKIFKIEVKGENVGTAEDSVFVKITKYEMSNGYTYSDDYIWSYFSINPGRNETSTVDETSGLIDKDFLPVAKVYMTIDEVANPLVSPKNPIYVVLKVI